MWLTGLDNTFFQIMEKRRYLTWYNFRKWRNIPTRKSPFSPRISSNWGLLFSSSWTDSPRYIIFTKKASRGSTKRKNERKQCIYKRKLSHRSRTLHESYWIKCRRSRLLLQPRSRFSQIKSFFRSHRRLHCFYRSHSDHQSICSESGSLGFFTRILAGSWRLQKSVAFWTQKSRLFSWIGKNVNAFEGRIQNKTEWGSRTRKSRKVEAIVGKCRGRSEKNSSKNRNEKWYSTTHEIKFELIIFHFWVFFFKLKIFFIYPSSKLKQKKILAKIYFSK